MDSIVRKIANEFNTQGFQIYEVGGHVRDSIMSIESHDIDMTTDARPNQIKEILQKFGSIYTVGEEFGTIGLCIGRLNIEVTTFRDEVYPQNSRKPKVVFGNGLVKDLSRRDFTVNAIARNPISGEIIDPFDGISDIASKVIRCVGNDTRFDEDPLRMMRAIRFCCQLDFHPSFDIKNPDKIAFISKERVRDELVKILKTDTPEYGIMLLCNFRLMRHIVPEFLQLRNVNQGSNHVKDAFFHSLMVLEKSARVDNLSNVDSLVLRMSAFLHDIGKPETKRVTSEGAVHFYGHQDVGSIKAKAILERLKFDIEFIDRVTRLISLHMSPILLYKEFSEDELRSRQVMRLIRKTGEKDITLLMNLVSCDIRSTANPRFKFMQELSKMVEACLAQKPETLDSPIDGNEIMKEFNLPASKFVGEVKEYLTNLVIDGKLDKGDKLKAIEFAKEYINWKGSLKNV